MTALPCARARKGQIMFDAGEAPGDTQDKAPASILDVAAVERLAAQSGMQRTTRYGREPAYSCLLSDLVRFAEEAPKLNRVAVLEGSDLENDGVEAQTEVHALRAALNRIGEMAQGATDIRADVPAALRSILSIVRFIQRVQKFHGGQ